MKKQIIISLCALSVCFGTAFADESVKTLTTEGYKKLTESFKGSKDCLNARQVSSWKELSRHEVILYESTKKHPYYIKLSRPAFNMNFTHNIAVKTSFGNRLCSKLGDSLIIDGDNLRVSLVKKLTPEIAKQLLAYKKASR